ncbi:hypothetical protein FRY74_05830 [Vicingus serpentipes]|jgi:uncharacterized protein DUF6175|uniref:Uncharacterized protein n=1 Tax=Vicingus serpentipes TaxID=1926625 RepID=A0A5C6RW19_9FLAO|nr:DUF6175 family protein [Vicingus serpentipes]TXB66089.1 hypothetical protein FRY74_05830 [Vicingus serpentipes]
MKKVLLICSLIVLGTTLSFGQAKKPTLMVVPSDAWCIKNGYVMEFDNDGTTTKIPDYKKAMQENTDILLVISSINDMMAERGFPLKNLESAMKTLASNAAEDNMRSSKESGASVNESPIDALKKVAKADIIIQLTWTVNTTGPKKSITFILQGLDAYTDKQIAGANGTGAPSFSAEVPVLLKEAVTAHIDNFSASLQSHFDDMFANGREVIIRIQTWDSWDGDLESEDYGDDELGILIEDWMAENTVKGRFSTTDMTESMALFEQVRIPLFDERGRAQDARRFASGLRKWLKADPRLIESKLVMKGLGRATLILGEK